MASKLRPLGTYLAADYPQAPQATLVGKILVAASLAATSLGGCGPALDPHTVDSAIDTGDLDGTTDAPAQPDTATSATPATPTTTPATPTTTPPTKAAK